LTGKYRPGHAKSICTETEGKRFGWGAPRQKNLQFE
jgi:hypothetical protein